MNKSICYYTHNICDPKIFKASQETIRRSNLPIVSVSLKPLENMGNNIVLNLKPGVITYTRQILMALENSNLSSDTKYVFFCEHDVLYHPSHFEFIPPTDDTYYFNENTWRWDYPKDRLIGYDGLRSLSGMCCNRELALNYYRKKMELIKEKGWEEGRDPKWMRIIGYEPGKSRKRGGFLDEKIEGWRSEYPLIDIRHGGTVTKPKVNLSSFKHQPTGWKEIRLSEVDGWNFKDIL